MSSIEQIHVLLNPEATCVKNPKKNRHIKAQLAELAGSGYASRLAKPADYLETSVRQRETAGRLDDRFKEGDILLEIGGDGTVFNVTNAVLKYAQSPHARNMRRLKIGGGYADDIALQLNSKKQLEQPSAILDKDNVVDYHPLEWRFARNAWQKTLYAEAYGTIGGSAHASMMLNTRQNRARTGDSKLKKGVVVLQALHEFTSFNLQVADEEPTELYELGFGNGQQMGEFKHCYPYELTDPRIFRYTIPKRRIARSLFQFQFGRVPGVEMTDPYEFTLLDKTVLQLNGEPLSVPENTTVTVSQSARKVHDYSKLLQNATEPSHPHDTLLAA